MTAAEIAAIVHELAPVLAGAPIREVRQRGEHDLCLTVRLRGRNLFVLLSAHPRSSRLVGLLERPQGPWRTSAFRESCRHDLVGARVESLEAVAGDRRATLTAVRARPSGGEAERCRLEAELFGRFSNLVMVDSNGIIREVLRPVEGNRSLRAGEPYVAVPPGASAPAASPEWIIRADEDPDDFPRSRAAAARYEARVARADRAEAAARLERRMAGAENRLRRKIDSLTAEIARADRAQEVRETGELLKAHLHQMRRGQREVEVVNYFKDPPATSVIPLDPLKTPQENLEAIFKRYRKLRSGAEKTRSVRREFERRLQKLDSMRAMLSDAPDVAGVDAIQSEAVASGLLKPLQPRPRVRDVRRETTSGRTPRTFESRDGLKILVGQSGALNETVTFRLARGEDVWVHVQDHAGAHVIVKVVRGKPCPDESLLDAAHLAVHFSRIRGARTATVVHTLRKFVSRLGGGAPAGRVSISRFSTLALRVEPERLRRLLGELA